jgi:hypothetical protein
MEDAGSEETGNLSDNSWQASRVVQTGNAAQRPSPPPPVKEPSAELNDIKAEFFGGRVRIHALLDLEGLEALEKKIAAFKMILS